ncbi:MAG: hypothetical protein ACFFAE_07435 [Candidatus Hodarchaeota archaeon]
MIEKVSSERHLIEKQYDKWQELIQRNAPFRVRLEEARLKDYIKDGLKMARR